MSSKNPANPSSPNFNPNLGRQFGATSATRLIVNNRRDRQKLAGRVAETIQQERRMGPPRSTGPGMFGTMSGAGFPSMADRELAATHWSPRKEALRTHSKAIREAHESKVDEPELMQFQQDSYIPRSATTYTSSVPSPPARLRGIWP